MGHLVFYNKNQIRRSTEICNTWQTLDLWKCLEKVVSEIIDYRKEKIEQKLSGKEEELR